MNKVHNEDLSCGINVDGKLSALETYPITRLRRREYELQLSAMEKSAFMSLTSLIGWLGIAASPFFAFYSSYLQQKLPAATVSVLSVQSNSLTILKKLVTNIHYPK